MKTNITKYLTALLMLTSVWGCTQDTFEDRDTDVTEGLPAQIKLVLDDAVMTRGSGLTNNQEQSVTTAQVLIFNSNGKIVTNQYLSDLTSTTLPSITTYSGTGMTVYVAANINAINSNYAPLFTNVQNISDLNSIKVYGIGSDVETNKQLVSWGKAANVTIPPAPATGTVNVALNYVASKIRVHMIKDVPVDEDITWTDWQVVNLVHYSYLFPQASDAVTPSDPAGYVAATGKYSWRDTTFVVDGLTKPGSYTVSYFYENRRGGRVANNSTPPSGYLPGAIGTVDPKDKVWYAPQYATAIIANGLYKKNNSYTGIKATIYLGANNYNDYNLERGKDYTYTVTVKGIDQIDIDSRVETTNTGFQADIMSPTLDCHYDWRPLRLGAYSGTLSVQIIDGATGLPPLLPSTFWLKMSAINLNKAVFSGGNYVRPTYNPTTDMVTTANNIAFTDPSQMTYKTYYLYADEFLTESGTRTAQIKVTSTLSPNPVIINVTQKGVQTMGTVGLRKYDLLGLLLPSEDYRLAVENQEEAMMNLTPGAASGTERTSTMQWGFQTTDMQSILPTVVLDFYERNGFENTSALVFSNSATGALRSPYGRTGSSTISEQVHDPIFNTYAARYCFEKNRDMNGDGKILGSEVKWYLPSSDEMLLIYVGQPSLSNLSGNQESLPPYHSSTEYVSDQTKNMGIRFDIGRMSLTPKSTLLNVRCVRKL